MTDEDHSDSRTEEDYEEGEEAYDDEGTLDEEEMLHPEENYQDELKMLEDDANLSIEELRQKYCNAAVEEEYDDTQSTSTSDDTRKSDGVDDAAVNTDFTESILQGNDSSLLAETRKSGNSNRSFPVKDDEDALKALLNAKYNANMALASYPFPRANAPLKSVGPNPAKWNDQDCELFERGMQMYGKNFCLIKRLIVFVVTDVTYMLVALRFFESYCQLPHRTVGEIVNFYYIWKKTERHDMFQERVRGVKNQDHPNCTDFMGGLMDQMDGRSNGNVLDIATNTVPTEMDLISKDWDWNNGGDNPLPHLDSDTIANVLQ
uniref:SANT domain-containing protein n=1 Tax=Elaeophora elaphi TaxID=1147741 RepID=A0A0R3RS02_9BILA